MNLVMIRTYSLHFVLERGEVVALGDAEVPVGVLVLVQAVRRVGRADGQHGRSAAGALPAPGRLLQDAGNTRCGSHRRLPAAGFPEVFASVLD